MDEDVIPAPEPGEKIDTGALRGEIRWRKPFEAPWYERTRPLPPSNTAIHDYDPFREGNDNE